MRTCCAWFAAHSALTGSSGTPPGQGTAGSSRPSGLRNRNVWVRAPISTTRPSASCRITTPARIAGQAPARFRGNSYPAFQGRLPLLRPVLQHRGVDMDHDLVALPGRARIQRLVQRRLREHDQGVAAPRSSPTRQLSHSAHERKPVFHPPRASNSRIRSSRRAVAASRWADSSAISSPRRSSSRTRGGDSSSADDTVVMATPPSAPGTLHREFRVAGRRLPDAIGGSRMDSRSPRVRSRGGVPRREFSVELFALGA
jgi:hypothetical protein